MKFFSYINYYENVGGSLIKITEQIPFDLPQNWIWTRLYNIATKITDGTHSTPKYTNEGIPFLSVKDMNKSFLTFNDCKYITIEEHKKLYERCNPEKNDLLLTKVGTTGIPAIVNVEFEFSLFVSVALIKTLHKYIVPKYLWLLFKSQYVYNLCISNTKGVNKNLVIDSIKDFIIPIPPLNMQKDIVEKVVLLTNFFK